MLNSTKSSFRLIFCCSILIVLTTIAPINAQQSIEGTPYSFIYPDLFQTKKMPAVEVITPDLETLQKEDAIRDRQGKYTRYAVWQNVDLDLNNSGTWITLPNGDRVWRLQIASEKAQALNLLYDDFYLPTDSRFFIYNAEQTHVLGAFSSLNNKKSGVFATGNVRGTTSILEYYEPAAVSGQGIISIEKIGYVYRFAEHPLSKNSDPCEVDVNCSEGNDWQDEKRGVVRISVVDGQGAGWCSGSLINNTNQDCKPYILTALHCGESSNANHLNQYIFYFNYESSGCAVNDASDNQSITGSTKRADSNDGGGNSGSDYMLVELNNSIPSNYNVYYNGWNAANTAAASGVSIHHPAGDRKKISTYNTTLTSSTWQSVPNTHWQVTWIATANGHGVTEGGSSGSAIFDNTGKIIGQLTGGSSYCTSPNDPDLYGKMSYNWSSNTNGDPLKNWLDPTNSGVLQLAGSNNPCSGGNQPTCSDGIMNGNETGVDCGGDCLPCTADPTCDDGLMNGDETGVDCGGSCRPCDDNNDCETLTLVLQLDDYGEETTWEVRQNGNVIESGGPYENPNVSTITKTMCMPNGCYDFIIYDDAEDGICCDFGNGSYRLTNSANQMLAEGGQFAGSETRNFCVERSSALPLSWLSFNAVPQSEQVKLVWQTTAEMDNLGFEVERSRDGNRWENIGWQAAATESARNLSYTFVDANPLNLTSFYRLAQVDRDGQRTHSEIRQVHFQQAATALKVYPNPLTNNTLYLDLPNADVAAQVILTDQMGRVLQQTNLESGQTAIQLKTLSPGVYGLRVEQEHNVWVEKVVKY